jgi:uncharacterized membrane protein YfcA
VILLYLAVGLAAGILSGMFGVGGGLIIVPAMIFFGKMTQKAAVGTSLGALLLPVGALGVYAYWRDGNVDLRAALWIALGMFVGAYGGALVVHVLSESVMKRAFALLLLVVAGRLWLTS